MIARCRKVALFALAVVPLLFPIAVAWVIATQGSIGYPMEVARSYLMATLARDFQEAYRFISSADQRVADRVNYLQAQRSLSGFAARLAKKVAAQAEFRLAEQEIAGNRSRLILDYKIPAIDELLSRLHNWDQDKLNALSSAEQRLILDLLEKLEKSQDRISMEGRETFNLVKENGRWKIFLDWASAIKVSFDAALPPDSAIEVRVLNREIFASKDEPFQTNLKLKNRGHRPVVARIDHRIEPKEFTEGISMIACGFLRPLTLNPGEEREISSAYILDPAAPKGAAVSITYKFNLDKGPRLDSLSIQTGAADR